MVLQCCRPQAHQLLVEVQVEGKQVRDYTCLSWIHTERQRGMRTTFESAVWFFCWYILPCFVGLVEYKFKVGLSRETTKLYIPQICFWIITSDVKQTGFPSTGDQPKDMLGVMKVLHQLFNLFSQFHMSLSYDRNLMHFSQTHYSPRKLRCYFWIWKWVL